MSITFRRMKFADARALILSVLPKMWKETGDADLPCEPYWDAYGLMEKKGLLFWVLAFEDDTFIGFAMVTIHPHMNSIHKIVSTIPTWWVVERPARGLILRSMINYCEMLLANFKPRIVQLNVKTSAKLSAGRIFEVMGFEQDEISYSKSFMQKAEEAA